MASGKRIYKGQPVGKIKVHKGAPGMARRTGNRIAARAKASGKLPAGMTHVGRAARNLVRNNFAPQNARQAAVHRAAGGLLQHQTVMPPGMPGGIPGPTLGKPLKKKKIGKL